MNLGALLLMPPTRCDSDAIETGRVVKVHRWADFFFGTLPGVTKFDPAQRRADELSSSAETIVIHSELGES